MDDNGHIFLSYRSAEVDFALRLAASLKNEGLRLWMDRMDIKPGADWLAALQEAVDNSAAVIAVISPLYVKAEYCKNELARAVRLKRPVFPVLLRPVDDKEWPIEIQRQQYIDFTRWQDPAAYAEALRKLVSVLREQFQAHFDGAPDAETRYITSLIAQLEADRRLIAYIQQVTEDDQLLDNDFARPEPGFVKQQAEPLPFALVTRPNGRSPVDTSRPPSRRFTPLTHFAQALERHRAIVLAGPPGSGKTYALRSFVLAAAHQFQAAPLSAPLPVLIHLADWQDDETLPNFLRRHWPLGDTDALRRLARGGLLLCLDGLSEMPALTSARIRALRAWLHSARAPRAVITCRAEDYTPARDLGLPLVMIQDLDRARIRQFAARCLGPVAGDIFNTRVLAGDEYAQHLHDLCRNPFLLSALILVFKSTRHGDLPNNLGQLLRRLAAEMWKRSQPAREPQRVSFDEVEIALTDLAYNMVDGSLPVYVSEDYALESLGSRAVLQAAVAAHFLEQRGGSVRFTYHALQEYFAALGLARTGLQTCLSPPQLDASGQRLPTRWDRAIVILCGILPNPDANVWTVAQVDPFLALACIADGINVQDRTLLKIIPLLTSGVHVGVPDSRVATARILAHIDRDTALPILIEALRDGAWAVSWAAVQTLWELDMPVLPGLAETLRALEDEIRDRAAVALRQLGDSALPTLLTLLRDPNQSVRRGAAWALGEKRDPAAVPALVDALYDDDHLVSAEAATALGQLRSAAAIPWLKEAVYHDNARVRRAAARALGWIDTPALADVLAILRRPGESDETRRLMVGALSLMSSPAAYDALLEATHDASVEVRCAAVEALENTGDPRTVKRLIECLSDTAQSRLSNCRVCDAAARLLRSLGTGEALVALERWLHSSRPPRADAPPPPRQPAPRPVSTSASGVLKRLETMTGRRVSAEAVAEPALDSPDWALRRDALRALKDAAPDVAVPALIAALGDGDNQVRIAAAQTLALFRTPEAVAALVEALNDQDYLVCDAVSEALKGVGQPAVPGLIALLESDNANARSAAVDILGAIRDPQAVPALIGRLFDASVPWMSDEPISEMAARALLAIDTFEARDAVRHWRRANPAPQAAEAEGPFEPDLSEHGPAERPTHRRLVLRLLDDLRNPDWHARQKAAKALREYARLLRGTQDLELVQRLTAALTDPDWVVRWAAAEALAWIRDKSAVPALVEALNDSNWTVRVAVVRALGELRDPGAAPDIVALLADKKNLVREAAAEALGLLGDARALPALQRAVEDPEPFVRLAAVEALGRLRGPGAAQPLALALHDADNNVRWAAARVLRESADATIVAELTACLDDASGPYWERQRVCDLAALALEHIGTPEALAAVHRWRAARAS